MNNIGSKFTATRYSESPNGVDRWIITVSNKTDFNFAIIVDDAMKDALLESNSPYLKHIDLVLIGIKKFYKKTANLLDLFYEPEEEDTSAEDYETSNELQERAYPIFGRPVVTELDEDKYKVTYAVLNPVRAVSVICDGKLAEALEHVGKVIAENPWKAYWVMTHKVSKLSQLIDFVKVHKDDPDEPPPEEDPEDPGDNPEEGGNT